MTGHQAAPWLAGAGLLGYIAAGTTTPSMPESSIGRIADAVYEGTARVVEHHAYDPADIRTWSLHFGKDGGTVTLLADGDLPLAKLLSRAGHVRVRIEIANLERITR